MSEKNRMNVPYFRPSIGEEERAAVNGVLDSGWLTTGYLARRFEAEFAAYVGAPHAVAVNSCTAALHLALEAVGIGQGDAVLVPTMTFAATAEVVRYLGAQPVLVDCHPETLCVDTEALRNAARVWAPSGRLKAVMPMHYGGQMADVFHVNRIAEEFGLQVVEDAAHTLPAYIEDESGAWHASGTTAPITCFSFYANKCITTGEGGMLVTTDEQIAQRAQMMSLHGLSKNAWNRFEAKGSWYYEIVDAGFKYNLTDIAAAIGVAQLAKAEGFWQQRRAIAARYERNLAQWAEFVTTPREIAHRRSSWHLYALRLNLDALTIDRAQFIDELKQRGITCSVHWMPLHLHPYYRRTYGYRAEDFPAASAVWPRLISLPIFPGMREEEVDYVCHSIGEVALAHRRQSRPVAVCA
jgi:perosamine synthetase